MLECWWSWDTQGQLAQVRVVPPKTSMPAAALGPSLPQVDLVKEGKPYVMFGDGTLAACKPISEQDLAAFIADCVQQVGWGGSCCRGRVCRRTLLPTSPHPCPAHARWACPNILIHHHTCPQPATDAVQEDKKNQVLPIGGPGKALTAKDQADLLFGILGKKPYYFPVSVAGGAWGVVLGDVLRVASAA